MPFRPLSRLFACALLAGCALVDQRTFAPAPEAKAAPTQTAPAAPIKLDTRIPLVSIDFSGRAPQYQELLGYAVHAAEARDRDVQYDVFAVVPKPADLAQGQQDAAAVMLAIMRQGVPAARIHLGLRADPALSGREVRVYVR